MLAGCSFSSSRHQMSSTQRFDILQCGGFSKRSNRGDNAAPRVAAADACSFRGHPAPPVTQAVSWGAKPEGNVAWQERSRAVKRAHDDDDAVEEYGGGPTVRAKRTRLGGDRDDEVWFRQPTIAGTVRHAAPGEGEDDHHEEEKVFLVPSAAAFPHGMAAAAAAGPSSALAAAKQEELSNSPSPASSDGGAAPPPPPPLHAGRNGAAPPPPPELLHREAMELVSALTACADSISTGDHRGANYYLARLGESAHPAGPTPVHRVAAYFAEALALRAVRTWPRDFDVTPPRALTEVNADDDAVALRVLNAATPIPRFLHFTLNERLLRAFEGHDRVHVIDFDVKQGLQWPGLLQSLAGRAGGPPAHVRVTGVGESRQELAEVGARLGRVAASLGLGFEFHAVVEDRVEDVRLWMLHVKRGERVAVNCVLAAHRLLRDATGAALADFLALARSAGAGILLLAEREGALNEGRWDARFARALRYYAAAFDAVHASGLPESSPARVKAEEMFAREIRDAVAFEGVDRVHRHETFSWWRRSMEECGFRNAGLGEREAMQGRMIARMFAPPADNHYSVRAQGNGEALTLQWMDQPLYTVSAWTPASDADAGGSTTVSASVSTTASHSQQS
ncbi:hypothetical protein QOZ80_6BG0458550 [Eleusine coracana subsp. coracana]|nr:hypothetical protein QOZ80_6BG0458550 [Eleusine coracana subsp. coracana]